MARFHTDIDNDPALVKRLRASFNDDERSMKQWVYNALLLKLDAESETKTLVPDPLKDLPHKEKLAVRRYIKALSTYPEEFREALMEATQTIYNLHSRTPRRTKQP
jgi:hypothetical protein